MVITENLIFYLMKKNMKCPSVIEKKPVTYTNKSTEKLKAMKEIQVFFFVTTCLVML